MMNHPHPNDLSPSFTTYQLVASLVSSMPLWYAEQWFPQRCPPPSPWTLCMCYATWQRGIRSQMELRLLISWY